MEQWKAIEGYEGIYEVSDHGRVRSLDRTILVTRVRFSKRDRYRMRSKGTVLVGGMMSSGYLGVRLHVNGTKKTQAVHRLVATAFVINPKPEEYNVVRHLDGNALNNHYDNLAWGTYQMNTHDRERHGTMIRGVDHHASPLTDEDVLSIRQRYQEGGWTHRSLAKEYGITKSSITRILNRQTWTHV